MEIRVKESKTGLNLFGSETLFFWKIPKLKLNLCLSA